MFSLPDNDPLRAKHISFNKQTTGDTLHSLFVGLIGKSLLHIYIYIIFGLINRQTQLICGG